mgnify:CR=1 FL=1
MLTLVGCVAVVGVAETLAVGTKEGVKTGLVGVGIGLTIVAFGHSSTVPRASRAQTKMIMSIFRNISKGGK